MNLTSSILLVGYEAPTAMTMKRTVLWVIPPYSSERSRHFRRNTSLSPSVSRSKPSRRRIRSARLRHAEGGCEQYFEGKPEGKKPLRIHRCRCENNVKINLREIGRSGVD
jgi:hypothetical protein